ncbi:hypothetical protein L249_5603, partial [Ophiocordyceps polyrhachis-furcata BCC 54312]
LLSPAPAPYLVLPAAGGYLRVRLITEDKENNFHKSFFLFRLSSLSSVLASYPSLSPRPKRPTKPADPRYRLFPGTIVVGKETVYLKVPPWAMPSCPWLNE